IYFECWRQMRDFFYSPTMNGIDWKAMRDKYAALLPFVNHRNDLTYILGELISELNNGHAYVGGGERPDTPRIKLGLLGAEVTRELNTNLCWRARRHCGAHRQRSAALLSRLGAKEHRLHEQENRWRSRLSTHSRHAAAGAQPVHEALLSANP